MENPYIALAQKYEQLLRGGRSCQLGGFAPLDLPPLAADAPVMLLLSPHPDDECITGALALRARRECGFQVVNVAVTLGSKRERQAARAEELSAACSYLGFELVLTGEHGLEHVNADSRTHDPADWREKVSVIADIIKTRQPRILVFPHEHDWNITHIGTHYLAVDALKQLGTDFSCRIIETEFWSAMTTPDLMLESSPEDVGALVTATSFHAGEVQRNPYHLCLPAWMINNVTRGSELVGGQGGSAPDFSFATLYRVSSYADGMLRPLYQGGRQLSSADTLDSVLK